MNDLLKVMASDMEINSYDNESPASFEYRVCYSALGQWCLHSAADASNGKHGTSKNNQARVLNELLDRFKEIFPSISESFVNAKTTGNPFSAHIRRVYEETGYLLTDENNRNHLANYGRMVSLNRASLFFGIPEDKYTVSGLGMITKATSSADPIKKFLIRDDLGIKEYLESQFDPAEFTERDIDLDRLEFFNPTLRKTPSDSWEKRMETDFTLARTIEINTYYKVIQANGKILFADNSEQPDDSFTSYEYRRLAFALKAHFEQPVEAKIIKVDSNHFRISIRGHLPNREYYCMLLMSWPIGPGDKAQVSAFNKNIFLIRKNLLPSAIDIIRNIGIDIKEE